MLELINPQARGWNPDFSSGQVFDSGHFTYYSNESIQWMVLAGYAIISKVCFML